MKAINNNTEMRDILKMEAGKKSHCIYEPDGNGGESLLAIVINDESDREDKAAKLIKAYNSHDALIENLKRLIDRIEENELGELFPSALFRAKEALKNAE